MLGGEDEEGKGAVEVLAVLVRADTVRVAVCEEILRGHVSTVSIALEERRRFLYEILPLFDSLLDVNQ
jgi:hypothetical protein